MRFRSTRKLRCPHKRFEQFMAVPVLSVKVIRIANERKSIVRLTGWWPPWMSAIAAALSACWRWHGAQGQSNLCRLSPGSVVKPFARGARRSNIRAVPRWTGGYGGAAGAVKPVKKTAGHSEHSDRAAGRRHRRRSDHRLEVDAQNPAQAQPGVEAARLHRQPGDGAPLAAGARLYFARQSQTADQRGRSPSGSANALYRPPTASFPEEGRAGD